MKTVKLALVVLLAAFSPVPAHAAFSSDLKDLVTQGTALQGSLNGITVSSGDTCSKLGALNISLETYLARIQALYNQLSSPLSLTADDLANLGDLSVIPPNLAADSVRLSLEFKTLELVANRSDYRSALSAMLRLSDDIGSMADRILEMADRILIMADNIGSMADRILTTQQLQNANVALTEGTLLATQQSIVALSGSFSTIGYNASLQSLLNDTNSQVAGMKGVTLTTSNMATQLTNFQTKSAQLLIRTVALYTLVSTNSQTLSHFINGDTLSLISDLSEAQKQFSLVLEQYAAAINQIAPLTQTPILSDATSSMLRLTSDINKMSKRILEMNSKITVMADNIGTMAGRIVETQNLQQGNIELTQNSILAAQNVTLSVIKTYLGQ